MKLKLNPKAYLNKEFYIGFFSILFGIFMMSAKDSNEDLYLLYPKFIFTMLIVVGGIIVIASIFSNDDTSLKKISVTISEIAVLAIIFASRPLMSFLGLYSTVFLICLAISVFINRDRSPKNLIKILIFNIILIAVLFLAFDVFLNVNAPDALLF